jgi:hypothetical protein
MTLQDLSLIAQILGVLLIPASLFFVGMQMRQAHAVERGNAQRDILDQTREWWMACVEDEGTFDTFSAGLANYDALSCFRRARFNALGWNLMHIVEGVFFQHKTGLINASSHEGYVIAFLAIINTPGGRQWWAEASKVANAELAAYVTGRFNAEVATLPLWTDLMPFFRLPTAEPALAQPASS